MLYQINNGAVRFADTLILERINFEIRNTEKIAVVGRNGCGKTTFLKLIAGEVKLDKRDSDEDIFIAKTGNPTIGFLKQMTFEDDSVTLETEIKKVFETILNMKERMERILLEIDKTPDDKLVKEYASLEEQFNIQGGYQYEKDYEIILKEFGFTNEDKVRALSTFSGGQKTKIAFIKLLLSKPDILLLDEPTNHLDISTIEWLEGYLKSYPRAVVIVSHDRMFLDQVVDVVYEIEYRKAKRYPGNYSQFIERKAVDWEKQEKDYILQQKEIERLQTIVDRFKNKPTKVAMTRSKLKQIEHMDKIEPPARYDLKSFHNSLVPLKISGNDVLQVTNLEIGYDKVLSNITFDLKKGKKLGIIGGNGLGKSTFLKTLVGNLVPLGGNFHYGHNVEIGYFDQQMAQYTSNKQVINEFWDEFPDLTQTEVRNSLGAFLFTGDSVFKLVNMLSGGERVRLALAKIFQTRPNFLILDEPTNHMDIVGKETLEAMLKDYEGTVLFVSHDRYFIKQTADVILEFENGFTKFYTFGYEEYIENLEKKKLSGFANNNTTNKMNKNNAVFQVITNRDQSESNSNKKNEVKNYYNPGKDKAKKERRISKLEELMEACEVEITRLKEELLNPLYASDYMKLHEMQKSIEFKESILEEYMIEWDELSEQI